MDELNAKCNVLSNQVSEFNKPSQGRKTLIRIDTNKVAAIESMTNDDFNLFNAID